MKKNYKGQMCFVSCFPENQNIDHRRLGRKEVAEMTPYGVSVFIISWCEIILNRNGEDFQIACRYFCVLQANSFHPLH